MSVRTVGAEDIDALRAFFARIPEGDRTFFRDDVLDAELVAAWVRRGRGHRSVAIDAEGAICGFAAVTPLHGWSSHVGELALVVDPAYRGRGLGRALARNALLEAVRLGLAKVVVEVAPDQEHGIRILQALGFKPEALLRDQIRDQAGRLRDLIVLAHSVNDTWSAMATAGIDEAVGD
jgi:ribosomal protein S18 acetylase RimI-like enzyme